jgi:DNA polymerase III subunit alpha
MSNTPFIHLHNHTDYSLLDGACEISKMMKIVKAQNMPAIAMTDHGNLFGAVKFYDSAVKNGIHPVIGCELYVTHQDRSVKNDTNRYNHLLLLCENETGYRNLVKLVSTGYLDGFYYKPRVDKAFLSQHTEGLICLSGCLRGDVNESVLDDNHDQAVRFAHEYQDMFGKGNFFLEIQDHHLEQDKIVTPAIVRLSRESGIPLVVTNDSHYLTKDDSRSHEIMLCIQTGKTMSDENRMRFSTEDFYLKSKEEMLTLFGDYEDALDRTWEIAQRCQLKLKKIPNPFPEFGVPKEHSIDTYFEYVARQGFEQRRGRLEAMKAAGTLRKDMEEYGERLDRELKIIQQMKFSGYFLIVWDFMRFSRDKGIPVGPGRGSAAGSLVSYCMGITDIDPLQYDLLFERFLNPERISMPDVDIDFCTNRRGEVIQYVTEKYGREQVAQIITFGTLGARAAIKDVGRALDMSYGDVEKVTKLIPNELNIKLGSALEKEPDLARLVKTDERVSEVYSTARRLEGMCRNSSVHAAGVVISPVPLMDLVPLYKTNKDEIVTQYDMSGVERLGLLKMDFFGLTTLTIIDECLKLIQKHRGQKIVVEEIPENDEKTYKDVFCSGHTSGVFQFESDGMRDILRRYEPERLEDLCALNALYRPGPIQGGMVDDFINRKQGRKKVVYDLPELKPVLEETYGVILYQEQVMQIANILGGFSLGGADLLRRAMGKKKVEVMAEQREKFLTGAQERNFPVKKVNKVFDLMEQFAGYGFNKSHSAAYGYLAYVTAYLKAHYPIEFMSALLTSETGNTAKVVRYINECQDMGIEVEAPDVHASDWDFTPDGEAIRFGLGAVKHIGQGAVESIAKSRAEQGQFKSIYDFCESVDLTAVNRRAIESLIRAGAMDAIPGGRSQKFAAVEGAIEAGQRAQRDRESGQGGLFAAMIEEEQSEPDLPKVPDWTEREMLAGEKEMLGFYVSGHPLNEYKDKVAELATHDSSTFTDLEKGTEVALCGVFSSITRKRNREGKPWAAVQIDDLKGSIDGMVFANSYEELAADLIPDKAVLIRGTALPEENSQAKISIKSMVTLENARVDLPHLISIRVALGRKDEAGEDRAAALNELFHRKPGEAEVRLRLEKPQDFSVILDVTERVRPDKEFQAEIARICGPEALEILAT